MKYFASSVGYEGEIPRILIGDLSPGEEAFASTSNNTIAIDRNILASADSNKILSILAHELGHFNGYDSRTESTASRVENEVNTFDIGIGFGTPSLGASTSMIILPHADSSKDIAGHFRVIGGAVSIFGGEILLDSNNNFMGLKYSIGVTPNAVPAGEVHFGADSSIVRNVENIKVTNEMIKLSKEIEALSITGESASKNIGKINILSTKLLMEIRKNNSKGDKK